jgi:hypothetical protein
MITWWVEGRLGQGGSGTGLGGARTGPGGAGTEPGRAETGLGGAVGLGLEQEDCAWRWKLG